MKKIDEILRLKRNHIDAFLAPARSEAEREFFLAAYKYLEFERCSIGVGSFEEFVNVDGDFVYIDQYHGIEGFDSDLDVESFFKKFNSSLDFYPLGINLNMSVGMLIDGKSGSELIDLIDRFTITYIYDINYAEKVFSPSVKILVKHNVSRKVTDSKELLEVKEGVFYVILPPNRLNADELNQCLRQGFKIFQLDEQEVAELWTHEKFKSFLLSLTKNVCKDCLFDKRNISL
jgi:hypothetical protein